MHHIPNFGYNRPYYLNIEGEPIYLTEVVGKRYWWWVHASDDVLCGVLKFEGQGLVFKDSGSGMGKYLETFREALIAWYG